MVPGSCSCRRGPRPRRWVLVVPQQGDPVRTARKSERTIQRYLADLRDAGLIFEGDQELVSHVRADRRPTVYDLDLDGITGTPWIHGKTVDSPDEGHGETDGAPRGDRPRHHGESDLTPNQEQNQPPIPPSTPPPPDQPGVRRTVHEHPRMPSCDHARGRPPPRPRPDPCRARGSSRRRGHPRPGVPPSTCRARPRAGSAEPRADRWSTSYTTPAGRVRTHHRPAPHHSHRTTEGPAHEH